MARPVLLTHLDLAKEGAVEIRSAGGSASRFDGLMQRYAAGEARAFTELYEELSPVLRRFCRRLSRRRSDADDLLQDTFLRLHRHRSSYVPGTTLVSWILTIARSAHVDMRRHGRRDSVMCLLAGDAGSRVEGKVPAASDPESEVSAQVCLAAVKGEIDQMSTTLRTAYLLFRQEGLSVAQIAERLGTTGDAVKQRVHRAEQQLRVVVASPVKSRETEKNVTTCPVARM
jgi:RNA polymerase sigma-70 factor (ECF subfamily)